MKKYLGFFILGASLFVTSCDEDLLDPFAPGALTEDIAVQSSGDLAKLMNAAYVLLTPSSEIEFSSIFTDEASIGYANGGQGLDDNYAFLMNSDSDSPNSIWAQNYYCLSRVNRVIKFADNFTPVDAADQQVVNRLKAEAYTLRAHCHIQLLAYFSTNPKDRNALGPIISNDVYPTNYKGVRATNGAVYDLIDADLAEADALYATVTSAPNPIFANKNFTTALKARVNALRGDYANAIVFADQVINTPGLSLATFANYPSVFHTDSNPAGVEVIFKLKKQTGQTRTGAIWASVNTTLNGSPFYEVGRSLFNVLNTTNLSSASNLTITAISGTTLTIPGNTLQVNDMFVSTVSRPANATSTNGTTTSPANSLLGGKVYYVKSVNGDNITLTVDPTLATSATANFAGANGTGLSIAAKANYGDIRYTTNVHPTSIIDYNYTTSTDFRNTDKLCFRKYPGTTTNGLLVNDMKICRLSEMYLIKAEALVATGDLAGAAAAVKAVRDARSNRVQPLPVFANATDGYKAVLNERRIEFMCEGYRFLDLKRLGGVANEGILRDPQDCAVNGACSLPVTDYRFALPIPTVESNANGAILATQNPGY
ncbi:RagB/SusD family nutrient uptake outer membrane protein [Flavobacterium sp. RSB2_4_14]|uniref:RagB/SusD family nutrient uptake outer membrane protein n=1 Tax=Flavobacterium sp. RSB2_4_14 TaxID=3447665 RepID=UPI003F3BCE82